MGSEMCIRDRTGTLTRLLFLRTQIVAYQFDVYFVLTFFNPGTYIPQGLNQRKISVLCSLLTHMEAGATRTRSFREPNECPLNRTRMHSKGKGNAVPSEARCLYPGLTASVAVSHGNLNHTRPRRTSGSLFAVALHRARSLARAFQLGQFGHHLLQLECVADAFIFCHGGSCFVGAKSRNHLGDEYFNPGD